MRDSSILIRDKKIDGQQVSLNLPEFIPPTPHNLVLQPKFSVAYKSKGVKKMLTPETGESNADNNSLTIFDDEDELVS